jgi:tRNA threonylcarbamoyladenosine biosynthesis protein TsaB
VRLTLAIETSSIYYGAVLGAAGRVVAHRDLRRDDPEFESVGHLVATLLRSCDGRFEDIERIAVDVGPGNLSSVRAGVAYANGLAFSLDAPVLGVNGLELLALAAHEQSAAHEQPAAPELTPAAEPTAAPGRPVLCLRNAGGGTVYAGLFRDGAEPAMRHGPLASAVPELAADLAEVTVAGLFRHEVKDLLPGVRVNDSGVEFPSALTLHRLLGSRPESAAFASPINDSSAVFQGGE